MEAEAQSTKGEKGEKGVKGEPGVVAAGDKGQSKLPFQIHLICMRRDISFSRLSTAGPRSKQLNDIATPDLAVYSNFFWAFIQLLFLNSLIERLKSIDLR